MAIKHSLYREGDTIAALATPPGVGGIAVIRVSGKKALSIGQDLFSRKILHCSSHTVQYGWIKDSDGNRVDEVLITLFKNPRSFTGEDTLEISCHGGAVLARKILELLYRSGARPAEPGEFTLRAFLNGKLDLAQAEAVQELICAKSERAVEASRVHLEGKLSKQIIDFQNRLTECAAILEAWVDFPEEGVEFGSLTSLCALLCQIKEEIASLIETYHNGKRMQEGVTLCLVGKPNVGKSSLLNLLLDKKHAIVTEIPGTTRDLIEGHITLGGFNLRVIDTAGVRQTKERVEQEGIRRSLQVIKEADLVLLVLDASTGLEQEDKDLMKHVSPFQTLVIWNKLDLCEAPLPTLEFSNVAAVSALKGKGVEQLLQRIEKTIWKQGPPDKGEVLISNLRHKQALESAYHSFEKVIQGLKSNLSPEFISFDMREGLKSLGTIIGYDLTEEILSSIFSRFCIGK